MNKLVFGDIECKAFPKCNSIEVSKKEFYESEKAANLKKLMWARLL